MLLVLLGLALAGCADTHTTDVESARGTVDALLKTCAGDRPQDALEVLNPPARQAFLRAGGRAAGCAELLGVEGPARVTRVRAGDLSARVELQAASGETASIELEKSRGTWYVAHGVSSG